LGCRCLARYLRDYVIEHLADDDAVLVIDETGFLKQGNASCGVARQYTGSGRQDYELPDRRLRDLRFRHGHAFIDRALYLPKEWTDDPDRLQATYVLPARALRPNQKLATRMIARAIAAAVAIQWVAADTVYGVGDIEQQLRQAGKGYVLGVSSAHVSDPGASGDQSRHRRGHRIDAASIRLETPVRRGTEPKDRRLHDGAISNWPISMPASSTTQMTVCGHAVLLIRRRIADGTSPSSPPGAQQEQPSKTLVAVEGHRWAIEDSFETAKNEFGLDHNESRSWHGCIATYLW